MGSTTKPPNYQTVHRSTDALRAGAKIFLKKVCRFLGVGGKYSIGGWNRKRSRPPQRTTMNLTCTEEEEYIGDGVGTPRHNRGPRCRTS